MRSRAPRVLVALAAALGGLAASEARAQSPALPEAQADPRLAIVTVAVTPEVVAIGEPFTVRIRVRAPKIATVRFPDVPDAMNGVDPVDPRAVEEGPAGEALDLTARYAFVAWDIGRRGPSFGPVTVSVAGRAREVSVGTPTVEVRPSVPADSAQQVPRDARAPVPLPGRLWQVVVLAAIALALGAWYVGRRVRARRRSPGAVAADAWTEATVAFSRLGELRLDESGEPGRHVIAHVDVLRAYLERRFPPVRASLAPAAVVAALETLDFPLPAHRVATLLERDAALRFAQAAVTPDEAAQLASEARDLAVQLQLAHEARLRALERPQPPRRR